MILVQSGSTVVVMDDRGATSKDVARALARAGVKVGPLRASVVSFSVSPANQRDRAYVQRLEAELGPLSGRACPTPGLVSL